MPRKRVKTRLEAGMGHSHNHARINMTLTALSDYLVDRRHRRLANLESGVTLRAPETIKQYHPLDYTRMVDLYQ